MPSWTRAVNRTAISTNSSDFPTGAAPTVGRASPTRSVPRRGRLGRLHALTAPERPRPADLHDRVGGLGDAVDRGGGAKPTRRRAITRRAPAVLAIDQHAGHAGRLGGGDVHPPVAHEPAALETQPEITCRLQQHA